MMRVRRAAWRDCWTLWRWRNDPSTRAWMRDRRPVPRWRHALWFRSAVSSADMEVFVAEWDGEPVATGHITYSCTTAEFSVTVAPQHRGSGFGSRMVREMLSMARHGHVPVACIRRENEPSVRAFTRAGFVQVSRRYQWVVLAKL